MANAILRVRNLKTNFYTYAGVVRALDGVGFEVAEGETVGLVGETGCGKSVTALSVLRLIPQPPGKIEEGEILFDVPPDVVAKIDEGERVLAALYPRVFRKEPPPDWSVRRLSRLLEGTPAEDAERADVEAFRAACRALAAAKRPHDLLSKSEEEMQAIRGNKIAMIFQDPMQALNPVFPVGDQIAENILLHQRASVAKALVNKMELEEERDALALELDRADSGDRPASASADPRPRPAAALLVGLVWLLVALSTGVLYVLLLSASVRSFPGILGAMVFALTAKAIVSAAGLGAIQQRAWALRLALPGGIMDLAVKGLLALLPLAGWVKLVLLAEALVDIAALYYFTQLASEEDFRGRRSGWRALVHDAEGEPDAIFRVRDLVGASRLSEAARESFLDRLDRFAAKAPEVVGEEPVTGHFHPLLPRRFQLGVFRRIAADPKARLPLQRASGIPVFGSLLGLRLLVRVFERPLYQEGLRWAIRMLGRVRIPDPERVARHYPYELSGGMQQRALIAIALSCNPRLLIADEPTTALDVTIQAQILELIKEIKAAFGTTVLIITHDLGVIADMCNRVCVMYAGTIAEDAVARRVFKSPLHPYTQGLMRAIPSHAEKKERLEIILGSVPNLIRPPPGCRFHPRCPVAFERCGWSPDEVASRLRDAAAGTAAPQGIDPALVTWTAKGPTVLSVGFSEGTSGDAALTWVRALTEASHGHAAVRAITAIAVAPGTPTGVTVTLIEPVKPPPFEPEPGHLVECLLYEGGLPIVALGGAGPG